jgi:hypothetical protein
MESKPTCTLLRTNRSLNGTYFTFGRNSFLEFPKRGKPFGWRNSRRTSRSGFSFGSIGRRNVFRYGTTYRRCV